MNPVIVVQNNYREKLSEVVSKPLKKVDYDMGMYDWDKIARHVDDVYRQLSK